MRRRRRLASSKSPTLVVTEVHKLDVESPAVAELAASWINSHGSALAADGNSGIYDDTELETTVSAEVVYE